MRNLDFMLKEYELLASRGKSTTETAMDIYTELLDLGAICNELSDEEVVEEYLFRYSDYDFKGLDILDLLVDDITSIALIDSLPTDMVHELAEAICAVNSKEDEVVEDKKSEYLVSWITIDTLKSTKDVDLVGEVFNSLDEIREFADNYGLSLAIQQLLSGADKDTGSTGMLSAKEAVESLSELGDIGAVVAREIPEGADSVMTLVTTNKDRNKMYKADMFVVFKVA